MNLTNIAFQSDIDTTEGRPRSEAPALHELGRLVVSLYFYLAYRYCINIAEYVSRIQSAGIPSWASGGCESSPDQMLLLKCRVITEVMVVCLAG